MRVEPYAVDSIVHVMKRGARGFDITRDDADRWRFVRLMYLLNDEFAPQDFGASTSRTKNIFDRPAYWPERKPLVDVLAWTLMPNHFHLILKEIQDGGISKFMQRLCGSMTLAFNAKYGEQGSIFQGGPKIRTVESDKQLRYLVAYVLVKNPMQLYRGGLGRAVSEFEKAWEWAIKEYHFSSLSTYANGAPSPIISPNNLIFYLYKNKRDFKNQSYDMVHGYIENNAILAPYKELFIEE